MLSAARKYNQEQENEVVWTCKKEWSACTDYIGRTYRGRTSSRQDTTEMERWHYRVDADDELVDRQCTCQRQIELAPIITSVV